MEINFTCPINHTVLEDPVLASDGHTYEREAIETWFKQNPKKTRSPITNAVLNNTNLIPNHLVKSAITSWKQMVLDSNSDAASGSKRDRTDADQTDAGPDSKKMLIKDAHDFAVFLNKVQPLVDSGDIHGLIDAMRPVMSANILIETNLFETLATMSYSDKDHCETVVGTGGMALLVNSIKFYATSTDPRCPAMYTSAFRVLTSITRNFIDYPKRRSYVQIIDETGAIEAVIQTMHKYISEVPLITEAIHTLANIVNTFVDVRSSVFCRISVVVSTVKIAVKVLEHHKQNSRIVRTTFTLLSHLSEYPAGIDEIIHSHAVLSILSVTGCKQNVGGRFNVAEVAVAACATFKAFCKNDKIIITPQPLMVEYLCDAMHDKTYVNMLISWALPALLALITANDQNRKHVNDKFDSSDLSSLANVISKTSSSVKEEITEQWITFLNTLLFQDTVPFKASAFDFLRIVVYLMKQFKNNLKIQREGISIIKKYMDCNNYDKYLCMHESDAVEVLVHNIKHHLSTIPTCMQSLARTLIHDACMALSVLSNLSFSHLSKDVGKNLATVMRTQMHKCGVISAVVTVIMREASNGGTGVDSINIDTRAALELLPNLCYNEANYSAMLTLDALKPIFALVTLYRDIESVVTLCLSVLSKTYGRFKSFMKSRQVGMYSSHVESLLCVMKLHPNVTDIQISGCIILTLYCDNGYDSFFDSSADDALKTILSVFPDVEACNVVLETMKRNPESAWTQFECCKFISSFVAFMNCLEKRPLALNTVLASSGLELVLAAFQKHSAERNMPIAVCMALTQLCRDTPSQAQITVTHGVEVALSILQSELATYIDLKKGMCLINAMLTDNADKSKFRSEGVNAVTANGAIKIMVQTMATKKLDTNGEKKTLVMQICYCMRALCKDPMQCETFAVHGGIQILLDIIKSHKNNSGQWSKITMDFLSHISKSQSFIFLFVAAGGIQTAMEFVTIGPNNKFALKQMANIFHNIAQVPSCLTFMKDPPLGVLQYAQEVLKSPHNLDDEIRQRYTKLAEILA